MRELIMIRYYACVIYCTLELSRSIYKRLFIRYEMLNGWARFAPVTYCAAAGSECWTVTFRNKKKQGGLFIDTWNNDQNSVLFYTFYLLPKCCSGPFTG